MKKRVLAALCAAMVLSLTACGDKPTDEADDNELTAESESGSAEQTADSQSSISETESSVPKTEYEFSETDYEYEEFEDGIRITKYLGNGGDVGIPDTIDGKSVIAICSDTFSGCEGLTSIYIPSSITRVSLTGTPFDGCVNLKSINVAEDNPALFSAQGILYQREDDDVVSLAYPPAFEGDINVPEGVTEFGFWDFDESTPVKSVNFPSSVNDIELNALESWTSIQSVTVAEGNPKYCVIDGMLCEKGENGKMDMIFCPADKGGDIVVPDGIASVCFLDETLSRITSLTLGKDVTELSSVGVGLSSAFSAPPDEYDIPESVRSEHRYVYFDRCDELVSLNISEDNPVLFCNDGLFGRRTEDGEIELLVCLPYASGEIVIPDGVTMINSSVFVGCKNVTSVIIPDSVDTIGTSAFRGCTGLESVKLPDGITTIGWSAFEDCTSLKSIELPDSVTYVGSGVFDGCDDITVTYKGKSYTRENMGDLYDMF